MLRKAKLLPVNYSHHHALPLHFKIKNLGRWGASIDFFRKLTHYKFSYAKLLYFTDTKISIFMRLNNLSIIKNIAKLQIVMNDVTLHTTYIPK